MADLESVRAALVRRGFSATVCADRAAAADYVMREAEKAASVGRGGSETVKALGVLPRLAAAGKEVRDHATDCDLFLLSANAVTEDGRLVNVDGTGNRVAASIYGPREAIFVVGRNKVVSGGLDAALARVKRCACPPNCRRLGKRTPCAETGACADCDSPDRICRVTVIHERPTRAVETHVVLVDEDLGY